jgi:hypothetical protein
MDHCPRRTVLLSGPPRVVAALFCPLVGLPAALLTASPTALS